MTNTEILARGYHHYYHHTTSHGGGHLSGAALAVIVVVALIALGIYAYVKSTSQSSNR